jgi:hypothetical protein
MGSVSGDGGGLALGMQELIPCYHTPNCYSRCVYKDYIFRWWVALLTVTYGRNFYSYLSSFGSNLYSFFRWQHQGFTSEKTGDARL